MKFIELNKLGNLELLEFASSGIDAMTIIIGMPLLMNRIEHLLEEKDEFIHKNIIKVSQLFEKYKKHKATLTNTDPNDIIIPVP